jgi:toluene monooxygenase system protein B
MALFPIIGRFEGDFVPHLVAVDTDDTMSQIAEKIATHSVERRVAVDKGAKGYRVFLRGEMLSDGATLASTMAENSVPPLQWFDVRWKK